MSAKNVILYLRPFNEDTIKLPDKNIKGNLRRVLKPNPFSHKRLPIIDYESQLKRSCAKYGQFITIGKPGDKLPRLGASRAYLDDTDWQITLSKLISKVQLVLIFLGESKGILWELEQVIKHAEPENVILCLPLKMGEPDTEKYEKYITEYMSIFPCDFPHKIGNAHFIYFSKNWTPHLLEPKRSKFHVNPSYNIDGNSRKINALVLESLNRNFGPALTPYFLRDPFYNTGFIIIIIILLFVLAFSC